MKLVGAAAARQRIVIALTIDQIVAGTGQHNVIAVSGQNDVIIAHFARQDSIAMIDQVAMRIAGVVVVNQIVASRARNDPVKFRRDFIKTDVTETHHASGISRVAVVMHDGDRHHRTGNGHRNSVRRAGTFDTFAGIATALDAIAVHLVLRNQIGVLDLHHVAVGIGGENGDFVVPGVGVLMLARAGAMAGT